nr:AIR carboxylase family protein [Legionella sainthelensi]
MLRCIAVIPNPARAAAIFPRLCESAKTLNGLEVNFDTETVSAHRTSDKLYDYA